MNNYCSAEFGDFFPACPWWLSWHYRAPEPQSCSHGGTWVYSFAWRSSGPPSQEKLSSSVTTWARTLKSRTSSVKLKPGGSLGGEGRNGEKMFEVTGGTDAGGRALWYPGPCRNRAGGIKHPGRGAAKTRGWSPACEGQRGHRGGSRLPNSLSAPSPSPALCLGPPETPGRFRRAFPSQARSPRSR